MVELGSDAATRDLRAVPGAAVTDNQPLALGVGGVVARAAVHAPCHRPSAAPRVRQQIKAVHTHVQAARREIPAPDSSPTCGAALGLVEDDAAALGARQSQQCCGKQDPDAPHGRPCQASHRHVADRANSIMGAGLRLRAGRRARRGNVRRSPTQMICCACAKLPPAWSFYAAKRPNHTTDCRRSVLARGGAETTVPCLRCHCAIHARPLSETSESMRGRYDDAGSGA